MNMRILAQKVDIWSHWANLGQILGQIRANIGPKSTFGVKSYRYDLVFIHVGQYGISGVNVVTIA